MAKQTICKYCGKPVKTNEKVHVKQKVHTECAAKQKPDFVFDCGDFHIEARTELMSNPQQRKMFRMVNDYVKAI